MTEKLAEILIDFLSNNLGHIEIFGYNLGAVLGESLEEIIIFIISMLPVLELRGGLIAAKLLEVEWLKAFIICYIGNMLPIPFILLFIRKIFGILKKIKFTRKIVEKLESKSKKKSDKFKKGTRFGLFTFVAIPLPGTGGWTGALIAALLDMRLKFSLPIIAVGVLCAGIIISVIAYFIPGAFGL